jgi:hypothetical protein
MSERLKLRLVPLEGEAVGGSAPSFVVRMPVDADREAVRAAITDHQRRTGWMGPIVLAPPEMTEAEWLARFGRP